MKQAHSITAEELIRALKRRKAALPAEIGSFVVLEACESLLLAGPRFVTTGDISIFEDGSVRLTVAPACAEAEAAQGLHKLLAAMLVAAGPAPLPALMRLLEKGPSSGTWTLASMRNDLEASLVPLNRNASRRVLSRFVREVGWSERPAPRKPTFSDLDSELSSFLDTPGGGRRPPLLIQPEADVTYQDPVEEIEPADDPIRFFESARPEPRAPRELVAREPTGKTILDPVPEEPLARSQPPQRASSAASSPSAVDVARQNERAGRAPSLRPMP